MHETQLISERQLAGMVIVRLAQTLAFQLGADQSPDKTTKRIEGTIRICLQEIENANDGDFELKKQCGDAAMSMIGYIAKGNNPYKL